MTTNKDQVPFKNIITAESQLRALYRDPVMLVAKKMASTLDDMTTKYIEAAPFLLIATADVDGRCSVSPRGGHRGFVAVLDSGRLLIPDLVGNNLIESLQNIVANPQVGLLLILPGQNETLRIDGRAWVTTDSELLDQLAVTSGRRPKVAIGVEVQTVYTHCSKSFERSQMWAPESWENEQAPNIADVYIAHLASNDVDLFEHLGSST